MEENVRWQKMLANTTVVIIRKKATGANDFHKLVPRLDDFVVASNACPAVGA